MPELHRAFFGKTILFELDVKVGSITTGLDHAMHHANNMHLTTITALITMDLTIGPA